MGDEGRALITETERRILSGEKDVTDNYRYKARSLVRRRIEKEGKLKSDVEILRENHPELFESLQRMVCDNE